MIYLDNAATTPLSMETQLYLREILNEYGNPSSMYDIGFTAKEIVTNARQNVAKFINAEPSEIIFTSGGSASNTLAIRGFTEALTDFPILYSPICHKSISKMMESDEFNTCQIMKLEVNTKGEILLSDLVRRLDWMRQNTHYSPLVVIGLADSEIGTVQRVKEICEEIHNHKGYIYLDATGGIASIPCDVKELDVDMMGFSAHKLGALKGCGVLYVEPNIELVPLIYGAQEQGLFGGTENVLGIASLGYALEHWDYTKSERKAVNASYLWNKLKYKVPDIELIGQSINVRNHGNLFISFKDVMGESLMTLLSMNEILVSTGSACMNLSTEISSTLKAIGMSEEEARTCIRFSLSGDETLDELDFVADRVAHHVKMLRELHMD